MTAHLTSILAGRGCLVPCLLSQKYMLHVVGPGRIMTFLFVQKACYILPLFSDQNNSLSCYYLSSR